MPMVQTQTHRNNSEVQKRTFTKWLNNKLASGNYKPVDDIFQHLSDGVALNNLLTVISGLFYEINDKPKMKIHELENLKIFTGQCDELGIQLVNCGGEDIRAGNEKIILGLIFTLIQESQYLGTGLDRALNVEHEILSWVKTIASDYGLEHKVRNFSTDWKDGKLLNCILDKYDPQNCGPFKDTEKRSDTENVKKAFTNAEEFHQIPRLLDVEDLTETPHPDAKSVFAYVSEYYNKFRNQKLGVVCHSDANSVYSKEWLMQQQNNYERYVKRFNGESKFIDDLNKEISRDMLKIGEKINQHIKARELSEITLLKLSAVHSNINTVLGLVNMPLFEPKQTPEKCQAEFVEVTKTYVPELERLADISTKSEEGVKERVEETWKVIKPTADRASQIKSISKVLANPGSDAQRRGLARRLRLLYDIDTSADINAKTFQNAVLKFNIADIRKAGEITNAEYRSLANIIGLEASLTTESVTREQFLDEVAENLKFLNMNFADLSVKKTNVGK